MDMLVFYRYNRKSKWRRGKVMEMRVSKRGISCKVYQFVEDAKVLDWRNRIKGVPQFKKRSGWFFFCWLPIENVKTSLHSLPK